MSKKKISYREKYRKDTTFNQVGRMDLIKNIKEAGQILAIEGGKYDNGKEFLVIKIDDL
jgi:hypothetical protein